MLLQPGNVFANRFEIDRTAGSGGMGTVYRARDRYSGGIVALKLIHTHASIQQGSDADRFAREAQLLSELRHPGIVTYLGHGQTPQGDRFLAMEWLDGEDLAQRLARGPLSIADAMLLVQGVSEALSFAHQRGVLHRDLKPTNLFLPGGDISRVKILDFGIARRLVASKALTRTGTVIGTPEYMAPEQARGQRALTPAADIFSLGCILYECLVGEPPFVADHLAAVLVRILFEDPTSVTQRRSGVPDAVVSLLAGMLVKDPAQRTQTASEVVAAVMAIGSVTELPLLPTLTAPPRSTPAVFLDSEQVLLSLVLALSPRGPEPAATTMPSSDALAEVERHGTLLTELRGMGAHADFLLGGALVITLPQLPSAKDQAAMAGRCAMTIKERWPEARVAVVTGRGSRSRGVLTGDVINRAWELLGRCVSRPDAHDDAGNNDIVVDSVSAGLLETRFELRATDGDAHLLGNERLDEDAARLLLGKPTPCVGRERELSALEATLAACREDSVARAVLVMAPPGLGKSRLRHEFLRRLEARGDAVRVLSGRGEPMKAQSSYGLLGEALRAQFGVREDQEPAQKQAQLLNCARRYFSSELSQHRAEFLGELCGVSFSDAESPQLRAARQDPLIMSDLVEQNWLAWLRALSEEQPLLFILEDLHWADALTVKLVNVSLRELTEQAFMVLALARPEVMELYPNLWAGIVQAQPLLPLPKKASERLIRQVLGPDAPAELVARVAEQSAGNPLFLEELIRAVAERKSGELPETVAAMIQARIGRLPVGTRRALRAASVFGEIFWEGGLRSLLTATHGSTTLGDDLTRLAQEEIIDVRRERRFEAESEYRFRHALLRDAAYGLLSEAEGMAWHAAAGSYLETLGERDPGVLAEHFRLGKRLDRAVSYYVKAAEQAYEAGDIEAAQAFTVRGLSCGAQGSDRGGLRAIQASISFFYRERLHEVVSLSEEALPLLLPGSRAWCRIFASLFPTAVFSHNFKLLFDSLGPFLGVEPSPDARAGYISAAGTLATVLYIAGQRVPAQIVLDRIREISKNLSKLECDPWGFILGCEACHEELCIKLPYSYWVHNHESVAAFKESGNRRFQVIIGANEGKALSDLGRQEEAIAVLRGCLGLGMQIRDKLPITIVQVYLARALLQRGDAASCKEADELARAVFGTQNLSMLGLAHGVIAKLALSRNELTVAEQEARTACEILRPFPPYQLDMVALHSRILAAQSQPAEALRVCEEMVRQIESLGLLSYGLIDLYVALAEAHQRLGNDTAAREVLTRTRSVLEQRVADIPEDAMRATYLTAVPENARFLALALELGVPVGALGAAPSSA